MELQELSLKGFVSQLRYELAPRYPDIRGQLIEEVTERFGLPHWSWGDQVITFNDEDQATTLIAGGQEVRAQRNGVSDVDEAAAMVQDFFAMSLEAFGVKEIKFMGTRTYWGAAASSFDELRTWMVERLGSEVTAALPAQVGSKLSDVGWVFEFMDKDPKHRLAFGPMTRDQLLERVLPNASADDIPEAFLFMDLDRIYNESTHTRDEALTKWRENFERNLEVGRAVGGTLTGDLAIS